MTVLKPVPGAVTYDLGDVVPLAVLLTDNTGAAADAGLMVLTVTLPDLAIQTFLGRLQEIVFKRAVDFPHVVGVPENEREIIQVDFPKEARMFFHGFGRGLVDSSINALVHLSGQNDGLSSRDLPSRNGHCFDSPARPGYKRLQGIENQAAFLRVGEPMAKFF